MGLTDGIFGALNARTFNQGAQLLGAAEALRDKGFYGPAVRFFAEALERFRTTAMDSTFYATRDAGNRCTQLAEQEGEDVSLAYRPSWNEIQASPERFVVWYYENQAVILPGRLQDLYRAGNGTGVVALADKGLRFAQFATGAARFNAEFNCAYFSGLSLVDAGKHADAIPRLQKAVQMLDGYQGNQDTRAALTGATFYLGKALFHTRGPGADTYLAKAISGLDQLDSTDPEAAKSKDAALVMLGQIHSGRLSQGYDIAAASAKVLAGLSYVCWSAEARTVFEGLVAGGREFLRLDETIREASLARSRRDFAQARSVLAAIDQAETKKRFPALAARAAAELREATLDDPALFPEHAEQVRQHVAADNFGAADDLLQELLRRLPATPELEPLQEHVLTAKREYVDRQIAEADGHVERRLAQEADQALGRAVHIGEAIGYRPDTYDRTRTRLTTLQAVQLGNEANAEAKEGRFAPALAKVQAAMNLPLPAQALTAKLEKLRESLLKRQARAADQTGEELAGLVKQAAWESAQRLIEQAVKDGRDGNLGPSREVAERYFRAKDLLEKARSALSARDYALATSSAAEALSTSPDEAQRGGIRTVLDRAQLLLSTYVKDSGSIILVGVVVFLVSGGVVWQSFAGRGMFFSLLISVGAALTTVGALALLMKRSWLAHNSRFHYIALLAPGIIMAGASWVIPRWIVVVLAGLGAVGALYLASCRCPLAVVLPEEAKNKS